MLHLAAMEIMLLQFSSPLPLLVMTVTYCHVKGLLAVFRAVKGAL
jgi:hypothetical protein